MPETNFEEIARQLRKPQGDFASRVGNMMNDGNAAMNKATIRHLNIRQGDNILEIGMGNGFFVKDMLENTTHILYTGCDFSEEMVAESISNNNMFVDSKQALFVQANVQQMPFADESFTKIFTVNTIYFWDDAQAVLAEISRVLKPGGQFIIALRPKEIMELFPFAQYGFITYTQADAEALLIANNFTIKNVSVNLEPDLDFFGKPFRNGYLVVEAQKN